MSSPSVVSNRLLQLRRLALEHVCVRLTGSAGDAEKLPRHTVVAGSNPFLVERVKYSTYSRLPS